MAPHSADVTRGYTAVHGFTAFTCLTVVMQVLADRHRVTASIVFQAAVNRGHHLLQTLDSITYIPRQALALPFILEEPD